eukprot:4876932-Amphidinium_carterae.2
MLGASESRTAARCQIKSCCQMVQSPDLSTSSIPGIAQMLKSVTTRRQTRSLILGPWAKYAKKSPSCAPDDPRIKAQQDSLKSKRSGDNRGSPRWETPPPDLLEAVDPPDLMIHQAARSYAHHGRVRGLGVLAKTEIDAACAAIPKYTLQLILQVETAAREGDDCPEVLKKFRKLDMKLNIAADKIVKRSELGVKLSMLRKMTQQKGEVLSGIVVYDLLLRQYKASAKSASYFEMRHIQALRLEMQWGQGSCALPGRLGYCEDEKDGTALQGLRHERKSSGRKDDRRKTERTQRRGRPSSRDRIKESLTPSRLRSRDQEENPFPQAAADRTKVEQLAEARLVPEAAGSHSAINREVLETRHIEEDRGHGTWQPRGKEFVMIGYRGNARRVTVASSSTFFTRSLGDSCRYLQVKRFNLNHRRTKGQETKRTLDSSKRRCRMLIQLIQWPWLMELNPPMSAQHPIGLMMRDQNQNLQYQFEENITQKEKGYIHREAGDLRILCRAHEEWTNSDLEEEVKSKSRSHRCIA